MKIKSIYFAFLETMKNKGIYFRYVSNVHVCV